MDELFSVFSEQPQQQPQKSSKRPLKNGSNSSDEDEQQQKQKQPSSKKQKLQIHDQDEDGETATNLDAPMNGKNNSGGGAESIRARAVAVVAADEFSTEGKTEVPASEGLIGSRTGDDEGEGGKGGEGKDKGKGKGKGKQGDEMEVDEEGKKREKENVVLSHQVRHQVALPPGYDYIPLSKHVPPEEPFRTYPFTLDPFQKVSIASIERNESVLVSAHTSAGKTVVAEYAVAMALKKGQRVIYTSPIKALSNQKFRELQEAFGDVGLMTGDVTINEKSSCLVMTTEILRSMLYRGSEVMREVAWVIFDEIHYMRDKERGVVWEETIILLPHSIRYVFLSATIPNALEFAEWIATNHSQPCHVVYTDFRPTPLQHYIFPAGGSGIHLVVDEKGGFREENFSKAMGQVAMGKGEDPADIMAGGKRKDKGKTKKGGTKGPSDIYKIVKMIMLKNYNPVIVFAFAKKECEGLALQMSKLEFNTPAEREQVTTIFNSAIASLTPDDQKLAPIQHLLPLLKRGIGIHHGGLLPILKEVIEILFGDGLIKVLFATETFSIGLNMPAKTVVFTTVRKFDGRDFRTLSSGEYIQMSGRAGRRGKDDRGIVIMMCDDKLEPSAAKTMVKGEADRLDSAFHLGYNMVLNLMRVEGVSPEFMLERCFFQFQSAASVPVLEEETKALEDQLAAVHIEDEEEISDYYELKKQLAILKEDSREVQNHPSYSLPFLQPGRVVRITYEDVDFGWGAVVTYKRKFYKDKQVIEEPPQKQYIIDVLLNCSTESSSVKPRSESTASASGIHPASSWETGEFVVVPVLLSTLNGIAQVRINLPRDLRPSDARLRAKKAVGQVEKQMKVVPLMQPDQLGIHDELFKALARKIEIIEKKIASSPLANSPKLDSLYTAYSEKESLKSQVKASKKKIQAAHNILHLDELKCRKRVLRRLGFASSEGVVEQKGRVACEISTGDELLLTEMIFNGVFNDLSPAQSAALLSCFVFQEKVKTEKLPKLKELNLEAPLRTLKESAKIIAKVAIESRMSLVEKDYLESFKIELMEVVFRWCQGASFSEISTITDVFEGSIIRAFRRLQELLRQMSMAAKAIGNEGLSTKFEDALVMLERKNSVVFAASLYL